jgi:uncharacterized SAM-binding protein YcdF (DUF218 family)|tara:strand:- start:820 stop:1395 length:576 start_codon:yes stop_codon:yes gene_type:complete
MMLDKIKNKRIIIAIVLLILIFSFYFTYYLYQIYSHSDTNLKNKEYTAAIVLTGDQYRIQKGISLLRENIVSKLLISGVNKQINKKSIIAEFPDSEILFNCCIDLDMISTNTFENARESYIWIHNNNLDSVIIVSSFYHLPRVKLEFSRFFKDKQIIFIPANDNLKKTSFKKLLIEYIKYIRTSSSILIGL